MKVHELKTFLEYQDPNAEVILASDEEGNSFRPAVSLIDNRIYVEEWENVLLERITPNHRENGYTDEDRYDPNECPKGVRAVVLWP